MFLLKWLLYSFIKIMFLKLTSLLTPKVKYGFLSFPYKEIYNFKCPFSSNVQKFPSHLKILTMTHLFEWLKLVPRPKNNS